MKNGKYVDKDGSQFLYQNGKLHCEDGPAVIYFTGRQEWRLNGHIHRIDGPAIIFEDGHCEWRVKGVVLGHDQEGFWKFWNLLNEEQRENVELLKYFSKYVQ